MAYFSPPMARMEPDRPYAALDDGLLQHREAPRTRGVKVLRWVAIVYLLSSTGYFYLSAFSDTDFLLDQPIRLQVLQWFIAAVLGVVTVMALWHLYRWSGIGWYLSVGLLAFVAAFVGVAFHRFALFGDTFASTDIYTIIMLPDFGLAVLAGCLTLCCCWRRFRTAFGVSLPAATRTILLGVVLRALVTVGIYWGMRK